MPRNSESFLAIGESCGGSQQGGSLRGETAELDWNYDRPLIVKRQALMVTQLSVSSTHESQD